MNGRWLLLRLIKLLLHYESITKRKLIWWRFIIINTSFFFFFFFPFLWYKCTLSRIPNVPCLYSIFYGQLGLIIIYRKKKEKKGGGKNGMKRDSMASITFLVWAPHSVSPLAHFSPPPLWRLDDSVTAPVAEIVTLVGLDGHYGRLLQSLIESSLPLPSCCRPLYLQYIVYYGI